MPSKVSFRLFKKILTRLAATILEDKSKLEDMFWWDPDNSPDFRIDVYSIANDYNSPSSLAPLEKIAAGRAIRDLRRLGILDPIFHFKSPFYTHKTGHKKWYVYRILDLGALELFAQRVPARTESEWEEFVSKHQKVRCGDKSISLSDAINTLREVIRCSREPAVVQMYIIKEFLTSPRKRLSRKEAD